jgi:predicted GNAT family acetyltransferase
MSDTTGSAGNAPAVVDNDAARRFEMTVDNTTAFIDYRRSGKRLLLIHTEGPAELQGKGVGSALVRGALDLAAQQEQAVVPLCPFVASYLKRHPEFLGLVSEKVRRDMNLG